MKLGIFSKVYFEYEMEIALHKIKSQGMSAVQFNFANVGLESLPIEISQNTIDQIKEATINSGVNIAVISGTFNTLELNEEKIVENQLCFENVVKAAAALAVPYVSISTGSLNQEDFWSPHPDNHTDRAWSLLQHSLAWMLEIAETNQVTLVFEPEQANVVSTAEDALRLLREMDSPHLKVLYDAANLVTPQDHKDLIGKITKTLTALKDYIAIAHCKDAFVTEEKIIFQPVGKGNLPLKQYLNELCKNYDGPIIMHGLDEADVTYAINYLN
ncbi:sugar phosphate isomerase/epimerase family protein [Paenibacillus sp. FSL E2-0201]|uniref:sugar phosphate isomerase/epimerase family protein n=1 Tax=Paenibacillus sp. FSL E2-0201 TaxID=2954726 RepID=UPI0030D81F0A